VEFGPWLASPSLPAADMAELVRPAEGIDDHAKLPNGRPLWSLQPKLIDDQVVKSVAAPAGSAVFLRRIVEAKEPVTLTIGLGGGDRLAS
jgi:hypothetical protein